MTTALLIITHEMIGDAMLTVVSKTFDGALPLPVTTVAVQPDTDPDDLKQRLSAVVKDFDAGQGVLVLSDIFGATPCNIAQGLQALERVVLVTGLNLPMLFKVMNYAHLELTALAEKALEGGQAGVQVKTSDHCQRSEQ